MMIRYVGENGSEYNRQFYTQFDCNNTGCRHTWRKYSNDTPISADICAKCSKFASAYKIVRFILQQIFE